MSDIVRLADSPLNEAFQGVIIGTPDYRFDSQFTQTLDADLWDTSLSASSSAVHSATERWVTLTAVAGADSYSILQSHYHSPYTPGRGQRAFITFCFGAAAPGTGASRRVGYWDGTNGIYLEQTATGVRLVLDTGTTAADQTAEQAEWSDDRLNGRDISGILADWTKTHILVIDLQALYVGRVRVGFDIAGVVVWVHHFEHANAFAYPYIQQASLPIRYEAHTTSAAVTMHAICSTVVSYGGGSIFDMPGRSFAASNGVTSVAVTTRQPILAIRPAAQLNSINQNAVSIPTAVSILARTNDCFVEIVRNATIGKDAGAATWAAVDSTYSTMTRTVDCNAITGGTVVDAFFVPASATLRNAADVSLSDKALLAYSHLKATADTLAIVVTSRTNTSDVHGAIRWKELR